MTRPDIHRLIQLQRLLLDFQGIERRIHLPISLRKENDVEHSYHLAISAWFLCEYFPELNKDKVIRFALAHDLVEIYAGDTYAYGDENLIASKHHREQQALDKLEKNWPDFPDITSCIKEYETKASNEAKFVYALDKIMPVMVIILSEGYTWKKEKIALERLHSVKKPQVKLSPEIKVYYDQLYKLLKSRSQYFPEPNS